MRATAVIVGFIFMSAAAFSQTTYYVPDDFSTIQGAIDASVNGDTIIVRPGTYVENINYFGKAIHLKSEKGPSVTVIDGGQPSNPDHGSVVSFENSEGPNSIIEGFTITNGTGTGYFSHQYNGGGVYCYGASPTIRNDVISGNHMSGFGGGLSFQFCGSTVKDSLTITDTVIVGNDANIAGMGGGIFCDSSTLTIKNTVIVANRVDPYLGTGGGIYADSSNINLVNTYLLWNESKAGGGLFCVRCPIMTVTNCVFYGNNASRSCDGGAMYFIMNVGDAVVTNTIIWKNGTPAYDEIYLSSGTLGISYSDLFGGQGYIHVTSSGTLNWGSGMIDADPIFVDSASKDFHLTWDSPCRNTGDNSAVTELYDFENDPRIALGTVDMGADEFYYHLYKKGVVIPGSSIDIKAVGYPSAPCTLLLGSGIADPPYTTKYGYLYLKWPPLWQGKIGTIPGTGVLSVPVNVPVSWPSGSEHPFQGLVGPLGGPFTKLTNLMSLTVE